jgi:hypothetical protein
VLTFALVAGLVAAVVAVASMLPLRFPSPRDKRVAMAAAAADRFFLGFVVGPVAAAVDLNGLVVGVVLGLGLSIGSALVTKTYVPILALGALLGAGVGLAFELAF